MTHSKALSILEEMDAIMALFEPDGAWESRYQALRAAYLTALHGEPAGSPCISEHTLACKEALAAHFAAGTAF